MKIKESFVMLGVGSRCFVLLCFDFFVFIPQFPPLHSRGNQLLHLFFFLIFVSSEFHSVELVHFLPILCPLGKGPFAQCRGCQDREVGVGCLVSRERVDEGWNKGFWEGK